MTDKNTAPIACTLRVEDYPSRLAWIRQLAHDALKSHQRHDLTLQLNYAADAAGRVREMVAKEQACCAFLNFDLREDAHEIRLTIRAPEEARDAVDELFAQFVRGAVPEASCGCRR